MNTNKLVVNVMAPLLVGDPKNPDSAGSKAAWDEFDRQLREIKQYGATAVSSDLWWGLIQPQKESFDWSYYDKISNHIIAAGLKWIPILSFHQCGGNIGDDCTVLLPDWIWTQLALQTGADKNAAKYVSEQGNVSNEYISCWATELALPLYKEVLDSFARHFASKAAYISELNISLGPAGELRYPSYNSHDRGSDYPSRGALQAYSVLARCSFADYIGKKYPDPASLNLAWGKPLDPAGHVIEPPRDPEHFFKMSGHMKSQYGRDFFDWYSGSLIEHGRKLMSLAIDIFAAPDSAFAGIDIAAKVPGVHWRIGSRKGSRFELSDRFAELAAGLIKSSGNQWNEAGAWGYRSLISLFKELSEKSKQSRVVLHFTCLEMADGDGAPGVNSLAYSLVRWVGEEAKMQGLPLKGENALSFNLYSSASWNRIRSHLAFDGNDGAYEGITFLRMSDIISNPVAKSEMQALMRQIQGSHGGPKAA